MVTKSTRSLRAYVHGLHPNHFPVQSNLRLTAEPRSPPRARKAESSSSLRPTRYADPPLGTVLDKAATVAIGCGYMSHRAQVGIKELKDRASAVIDSVVQSGRPVTITKNRREVARIVPSDRDLYARLSECGLIAQRRKSDWKSLKLEKIGRTSVPAIESIISDRDER